MAPHQQRVVDEKTELDSKIEKLHAFRATPICDGLGYDEQQRLTYQLGYMKDYSRILGERIAAFK